MEYVNKKFYVADCIMAAVGTVKKADYRAHPFERIVAYDNVWNNICSGFISYAKGLSNPEEYATKKNYIDHHLKKVGRDVLTEAEIGAIDLLFSQMNMADFVDPVELSERLQTAKKKILLKNSLEKLTTTDKFMSEDSITWSDKYTQDLLDEVEETITMFQTDEEGLNLLFSKDLGDYYEKKLEERLAGKQRTFGWKVIDDMIPEGPIDGHGGLVIGSTGMGKSTLALNMFKHGVEADIPSCFCPIEMGIDNTIDRYVSNDTMIDFKKLSKLSREDYETLKPKIKKSMIDLESHPNVAICATADINLKKLEQLIKQFQAQITLEDKYFMLYIDLLSMISEFYEVEGSMAQGVEKAINKISILSKKYGFSWVAVLQVGRQAEMDKVTDAESIERLKPSRSSIKNSNAYLERARWCLSIFRPKYFAKAYLEPEEYEDMQDIAEVNLLKYNDGELCKKYFTYDGPIFKMEEYEGGFQG